MLILSSGSVEEKKENVITAVNDLISYCNDNVQGASKLQPYPHQEETAPSTSQGLIHFQTFSLGTLRIFCKIIFQQLKLPLRNRIHRQPHRQVKDFLRFLIKFQTFSFGTLMVFCKILFQLPDQAQTEQVHHPLSKHQVKVCFILPVIF